MEYIHSKSYIHRDLCPTNFLIGFNKKSHNDMVYLIDYGLAKRFQNPRTLQHIPYADGKKIIGTSRHVSINCCLGIEQSRRDDLESLGYILMYFNRNGIMPWSNVKANAKKAKYNKIMEIKMNTSVAQLCMGYPKEFAIYLNYVRQLKFKEIPDYKYLRKLFKDLFIKKGYKNDSIFDWNLIQKKHSKLKQKLKNNGNDDVNSAQPLNIEQKSE